MGTSASMALVEATEVIPGTGDGEGVPDLDGWESSLCWLRLPLGKPSLSLFLLLHGQDPVLLCVCVSMPRAHT